MLLIFTLCWSSQKMKEPFVGVPAKKAGQVSEGKVRWLHQQHELSNALYLNWKRNEKFSALAW